MAAGKINLQSNDGKVAGVVFEDGASSNVTVTVPKEGGVVATEAYADTKVSKTGDETIAGVKSFTDGVKVQNQNVSPFNGSKNYIINGNFDVWQRGTIFTVAPDTIIYTSDRWLVWNRSNQPLTVEIADNKAFSNLGVSPRMRIAYGIAPTTGDVIISQRIEDVKRLSSKTFTGSFYHSTLENFNISTYSLQNYGTGGSSDTIIVNGSQTTTGDLSFKRYSATFNTPDFKDKTIGNNSWGDFTIVAPIRTTKPLSIAQVQLEEGSVATPFENRPYGLELSLCQRYYETGSNNICIAGGNVGALTDVKVQTDFKVTKRIPPTIVRTNAINCLGTINPAFVSFVIFYYTQGNSNNFGCDWTASAEL